MTYHGPFSDTLFVDDIDIQALPGITVLNVEELYAPGRRRGEDDVILGQDGLLGSPDLPLEAYSFSFPIRIDGGNDPDRVVRRAMFNANLRSAIRQINGHANGGLVTLKRRLAKPGGGYWEGTAPGRCAAMNSFSLLESNPDKGETELEFVNLRGAWLEDGEWIYP